MGFHILVRAYFNLWTVMIYKWTILNVNYSNGTPQPNGTYTNPIEGYFKKHPSIGFFEVHLRVPNSGPNYPLGYLGVPSFIRVYWWHLALFGLHCYMVLSWLKNTNKVHNAKTLRVLKKDICKSAVFLNNAFKLNILYHYTTLVGLDLTRI